MASTTDEKSNYNCGDLQLKVYFSSLVSTSGGERVANYAGCRHLCQQSSDCTHWSWFSDNSSKFPGKCFIGSPSGTANTKDDNSAISGARHCNDFLNKKQFLDIQY